MAQFGLTQMPRAVAARTGQPAPTYRKCFDGAVSAKFPAVFTNNRWLWDDGDMDAIVRGLGMAPVHPVNAGEDASIRARGASVEHAA